jgi:multidrug efflux pump subunit AcrB
MDLTYDRETMSRLGINVEAANSLLNNAFGQREISTIYQPMNQYKVVMEVDRATPRISARWTKCLSSTATANHSALLVCQLAACERAAVGEPSGAFGGVDHLL